MWTTCSLQAQGPGTPQTPFLAFSRRGRKCLGETSPMQESILTEMAAFCSPYSKLMRSSTETNAFSGRFLRARRARFTVMIRPLVLTKSGISSWPCRRPDSTGSKTGSAGHVTSVRKIGRSAEGRGDCGFSRIYTFLFLDKPRHATLGPGASKRPEYSRFVDYGAISEQ
ncbi:hypothetical protein PoMZ_02897 [Pyricularia oryzae]|uniref:Uncharacterized protein n=1 Tax=Pyricularia oryzae TaxID=318829 RepID=A0A4P7N5X0_PYROR|nr:hypothetical protein PoMZ_02897 [Pyricularia oryzae]